MDDLTLDDLDPPAWPDASDGDTYLVRRCHELRRKPLRELTAEDLRIMIGQQIALGQLVPQALNALEADPLVGGDFYPDDLLTSVLRVEQTYWAEAPDQRERLQAIVQKLIPKDDELRAAIEAFQAVPE